MKKINPKLEKKKKNEEERKKKEDKENKISQTEFANYI